MCLASGCMSSCHNLVAYVWCPVSMMLLLCLMTLVAVNATSHPALHNWPIESNSCVASWGTMWPWHAAGGSPGQSSLASWVEWMIDPDGV